MSQTISRIYQTQEQALNAKSSLEQDGYSDVHMVLAGSAGPSLDDIIAAITKGYVLKSDARVYAESISQGGSLVTVHAPFGGAARAMRILGKYNPVEPAPSDSKSDIMPWDEATPMSCILQMPVLLDDSATFSKFWNVPPLADDSFSLSKMFGIPLLSRSTSRSTSFGLPLLSNNATPLSSLLHIATLSGKR